MQLARLGHQLGLCNRYSIEQDRQTGTTDAKNNSPVIYKKNEQVVDVTGLPWPTARICRRNIDTPDRSQEQFFAPTERGERAKQIAIVSAVVVIAFAFYKGKSLFF